MILYLDITAAGEQITSMSKLSVLHGKNIIVKNVCIYMIIYAIAKSKELA
jgi:hypothetical protein